MKRLATSTILAFVAVATGTLAQDNTGLTVVAASPDDGFNFPYVLKLPRVLADRSSDYLLVQSNNSGVSDDLNVHMSETTLMAERGVGAFVANRLVLPLLIPVFPRPASQPLTYTHALDRDTIEIESGDLYRLDLQLLSMIADARERLAEIGVTLKPSVIFIGFSASATFANRFSMLHPEHVAAVAIGGFNGILMLPVSRLDGIDLPFPLGLSDYDRFTERRFDLETWVHIPQFIFMGENDDNDAVLFDDAYTDADREIIYSVLGERMLPNRWKKVQEVYSSSGSRAIMRTYPGMGHGTDLEINTAMVEFLRTATLGD